MNEVHEESPRERAWAAMAELFLDTETRHQIPRAALACVEAGLSIREARRAWCDEVYPVVGANLFSIAGEWAGWDRGWLVGRIHRVRERRLKVLSGVARAAIFVGALFGKGTWRSIERCMALLLEHDDPSARERLASDLAKLARHYFDFCPERLARSVRERLAAHAPSRIGWIFAPVMLCAESWEAHRRARAALLHGEELSDERVEALRARFERALREAGAEGDVSGVIDHVFYLHRAPERHYHTLEHVDACLAWLDRFPAIAERPEEVELALWFHDAVYRPGRRNNEARSAELARRHLLELGVDERKAARVAEYVEATEKHEALGGDAALVVDLDLTVLASAPDEYDLFEEKIRREHGYVSRRLFALGRRRVLRGLLARRALYRVPTIREALEAPARGNLARRIETLSS
jgi:predicted metal-dependent HD superfamily phosphohydrolase